MFSNLEINCESRQCLQCFEFLFQGTKFDGIDEKYFKSHKSSQSLVSDGNDNAVSWLIKVQESLCQLLFIRDILSLQYVQYKLCNKCYYRTETVCSIISSIMNFLE